MNPFEIIEIPNLEKVGAHIVRDCLRIQPGELVKISGGIHQYRLLAQVALETRKAGGHPLLQVSDDYTSLDFINQVPDEFLGVRHQALKDLDKSVDVNFYLHSSYDPALSRKANPEKLKVIHSRYNPEDHAKRTSRMLVMEWPTPFKAAIYGMEYRELEELFWNAFWVDLEALTEKATRLKEKIQGAKDVEVLSGKNLKLIFSIGDRPIWIDTGCFTPELMAAGDLTKNLPCGEVYCSPLEDSVEGMVVFQKVFYQGAWIRDLELTFKEGRLSEVEAREGKDIFLKVLDQNTGDKDRLAELGIGLNPHIPETMGNTLLDEKVVGSIHLALGRNTMYGGISKSTLHWDLVCMGPTVLVDGREVMVQGELQL